MKKHTISAFTQHRIILVAVLVLLPLLLLAARLYYMQVIDHASYKAAAEAQYIRQVVRPPVRGQILSSDGEILAGNRHSYNLTLDPSAVRDPLGIPNTSSNILRLATYLEDKVILRPHCLGNINLLRAQMRKNMTAPIVLFKNLSVEEMSRYEELTPQLAGVSVTPVLQRDYPLPGIATHLLGMTAWKQKIVSPQVFPAQELHGVTGLERQFDNVLAGSSGFAGFLQDPSGFVREDLPGAIPRQDGMDLVLTLDSKAQMAADNALQGHAGALVAINPQTGAVLAMASAPTYDLGELNAELYGELAKDEVNKPLINRALSGVYLPGSIVKPLVALAALEHGDITPTTTFDCPGYVFIGNRRIKCANRYGHGQLDLSQAIAVSCNPFFIQTGLLAQVETLHAMYQAVGFGRTTHFDLPETLPAKQVGKIPSRDSAPKYYKRKWNSCDTAYVSIGQGTIEVTPLQAAVYVAALAADGVIHRPYIVQEIRDNRGTLIQATTPQITGRIPASPQNLELIRKAMIQAVEAPGASANAMQKAGFPLAAKTGTAEVGFSKIKTKNTWIICYGPLPNPSFAVACVIEKGASGGKTTAPIVVQFLKQWLQNS